MAVLSSLIKLSVVVAVLAVGMRVMQPAWLFRIPNVGFIVSAIVAGTPVPPYMSPDCWAPHREKQFLRAGDVVVSAGAKMGTTWTLNTVHQIRTGGDPDFQDLLLEATPWMELKLYPGQTWANQLATYDSHFAKVETFARSWRVFKAHYAPGPGHLQFRDDVKYIVHMRNPYDVAASIRPFFSHHTEEFRALWGGFPLPFADDEAFNKWWLEDVGSGVSGLELFVTSFVRGWWPYRHKRNVMLVHYADHHSDPSSTVNKLAAFLDVRLTGVEKERVMEYQSFKWMKANGDKFNVNRMFDAAKARGLVSPDAMILKPNSVVRNGVRGAGKKALSDDVKARMQALLEEQVPDSGMRNWLLNGGRLP